MSYFGRMFRKEVWPYIGDAFYGACEAVGVHDIERWLD